MPLESGSFVAPASALAGGESREQRPRPAAAWAATGFAACLALGPLIVELGKRLWAEEHYQFFPLLLLSAGWLGLSRYRLVAAGGFEPGRPWLRAAAWSVGLLLAAVSVAAGSPFLAVFAAMSLLIAAAYERGGAVLSKGVLPVVLLCLLVVPPPFGLDRQLVVGLQKVATSFASGLLDSARVRHLVDGVAIRLPGGGEYFVDAACSGIHSLFASLTFAGVVCIVAGHGPLRTAALLAASVCWVVSCNALRVFGVVVLSSRFGLPVVEGFGHEAVGVVVFFAIIGLILSTDRLFRFLYPTAADGAGMPRSAGWSMFGFRRRAPGSRSAQSRRRPSVVGLTAVGAALFAIAAGGFATARGNGGRPAGVTTAPKAVAPEVLPQTWDGWRRQEFEVRRRSPMDPAGEWSRIWTYRKGRLAAAISVDGPYDGWHDLSTCYVGSGYEVGSPSHSEPSVGTVAHTRLDLERAGRHGRVLFTAYTFDDEPVGPPAAISRRLSFVLNERLAGLSGRTAEVTPVYQVQLFTEAWLPFTTDEERELVRLFEEMRGRIAAADPVEGGRTAGGRDSEAGR